jgi:Ca2+-binding RTX toxin-like protein
MYGGAGDDRFVFATRNDSLKSAPDTIASFRRGGDHIDLRTLDGNVDVGGSQHFRFIGIERFSAAGQVRIEDAGADVRVEINLDDDSGAELEILVQDMSTLSASDFLL